jgi:outer membrane lipoprotein-sorting protein
MKSKLFYLILILTGLLLNASGAVSLEGNEVINKLNERFKSIDTMKGQLTITYQSGEVFSGIFMYMNPGKIYVKLTDPPGKLIITDNKKLWVYDSTTDVCGVQELEMNEEDEDKEAVEKQENDIKTKLRGGIERFLRGYEVIDISGDALSYVIEMVNDKRKYSDVKLFIDAEFMLSKAIFKDKNEDGFSVELSGISTGEIIPPGLFNFNVPANAQVVKNPLDIR